MKTTFGAACMLGLVALLGATAVASGAGLERIEPRVDRQPFIGLLSQLELDDDQRIIAELLYSDYALDLEDLSARIDARADAAGRPRVEDALGGRILIDADELRALRISVERVYAESWTEANDLAGELLLGTRSLLNEPGADARFDRAVMDVHRTMYLHPRRATEQDAGYAGDGVDVVELLAAATARGGALEGLHDDAEVSAAVERYVFDIEAHLEATADADRRSRSRLAIARIQRDQQTLRTEEEAALVRWAGLYRLNERAVREIGEAAAASMGPDAAARWRERFDAACFPRLFRRTKPERQQAWIARRDLGSAETEAAVIIETFRTRHAALCREAIALILRGRLSLRAVVHAGLNPATISDAEVRSVYQELLKNSGQRSTLAADTSSALEALLTDRRRKQMNADIAAEAHGRRR